MNDLIGMASAQWCAAFWLVLAIVLGVVEVSTFSLVSIWFALGALAAILPAALGASFAVQCVVFVLVAVITMACTRPFFKKVLRVRGVKTNADSIVGTIGIVVQQIDNAASKGRVHVNGLDWTARSEDGEIVDVDERVLIKAIEGVKVIVERIS